MGCVGVERIRLCCEDGEREEANGSKYFLKDLVFIKRQSVFITSSLIKL